MVKIKPFEVEQWMDAHESTPGVLNIAETCASSLSIADLASLATPVKASDGKQLVPSPDPLAQMATTRLTYGAIRGSRTLRELVAALLATDTAGSEFSELEFENETRPLDAGSVIVSQGAIAANYLVFYALVGPGDHVVCTYPTYQQLYDVPRSLGAEVSLWRLREDRGYVPDVADLEALVQPNTKMIVLTNPNNPLGVPIPRDALQAIVDFARARDLMVLCDEVYLPLFHGGPCDFDMLRPDDVAARQVRIDDARPPSILCFDYDRVVATGSMSKAFALAGIRIGWAATRDADMMADLLAARDYTTISVSQLDDGIARYALSPAVRLPLLRRNNALASWNAQILKRFIDRWAARGRVRTTWTVPTAGTTAFVRFALAPADAPPTDPGEPVDDEAFCKEMLRHCKVMMVPGSRCFGHGEDYKGYVRIGYVNETPVVLEALGKLDRYLQDNYA